MSDKSRINTKVKGLSSGNDKSIGIYGRAQINKTYKLYIGGKFPRTESGRFTAVKLVNGAVVNVCKSSRKDFRNAVVAARNSWPDWSKRTAYNRSQIIYRIAEMMESRSAQFVTTYELAGFEKSSAKTTIEKSIDTIVYYAGWCDKYLQIFSSVNPVSSPHFNFSIPEPMGVVGLMVSDEAGWESLIDNLLPVLAGANTCVLLVPPKLGTLALTLAEVLATSDVPGGVVNILTGDSKELLPHFGSHLDVNAVIYAGGNDQDFIELQRLASDHVLRLLDRRPLGRYEKGPYQIMDTQEIKTTWHPIGQ